MDSFIQGRAMRVLLSIVGIIASVVLVVYDGLDPIIGATIIIGILGANGVYEKN